MKTCCFIGHRNTKATPELLGKLRKTIICLIKENGVENFLFGSKSSFDDLCLKMVTELKEEYPFINRVYARSHYPFLQKEYKEYLLGIYDQTLMPNGIENAGKASYLERNQEMINASDFCVFYYDKEYQPPLKKRAKSSFNVYQSKSGTKLAYQYAKKKQKQVINLCDKNG